MNSQDKLNAVEASKSMIVRATPVQAESARAITILTGSVVGPTEANRSEFIRLRDQLAQLEQSNLADRIKYFAQIEDLEQQLAQFELIEQ